MSSITKNQTVWVCRACKEIFDKKGARDHHAKKCGKTVDFQFENKTVTLAADDEQTFHCQCDWALCRKSYKTIRGFQNHIQPTAKWLDTPGQEPATITAAPAQAGPSSAVASSQGQPNETLDEVFTPMVSSPAAEPLEYIEAPLNSPQPVQQGSIAGHVEGLEYHPYLTQLGFAINIKHRFLCCIWCNMGFHPSNVYSHLLDSHKPMHTCYDATKFEAICQQLNIVTLPELKDDVTNLSPLSGLAILDGYKCTICNKASLTREYLEKHVRSSHREWLFPASLKVEACKVQRFNTRGTAERIAFCVDPSKDATSSAVANPQAEVDAFIAAMTPPPPPFTGDQNSRYISPWLLSTRWHTFTEGLQVPFLRSLIAMPKGDEFPVLAACVSEYYNAALDHIEVTDLLVLQRLNTNDPAKGGIENTPLRRHQQADTHTGYNKIIVRLVAMLLRHSDRYPFVLPSSVKDATQNFAQAMDSDDAAKCQDTLHQLLLSLWATYWIPSKENPLPSPTDQFCVLNSLQADGGHAQPKDVTGIFAKLKYSMRLTFLCEIKRQSAANPDIRDDLACNSLEMWFTEKTYSAFHHICTYQHMATAITKSTMSVPRIFWTDRHNWMTMLYQGDRIELVKLQQVFVAMEQEMLDLWENKLTWNSGVR
ncbi:hypothetical protein CERSUDRAFT_100778 [Gelatoporia subvermispora B]|uniref:C2H2-type domain-containing protein n=1 Tax=Ceriporiopsis subvermispora (strain B) TaxID=914234 RepID=M2P6V8_CERS8|nr:hypothetical protein CERSUDRAFT_100778 [Gelatoporia subvermispora B]